MVIVTIDNLFCKCRVYVLEFQLLRGFSVFLGGK